MYGVVYSDGLDVSMGIESGITKTFADVCLEFLSHISRVKENVCKYRAGGESRMIL